MVQIGWTKSPYSNGGNSGCVELDRDGDQIRFQDSKNRDVPPVSFSVADLAELFDQIRSGLRADFAGEIQVGVDSLGIYRLAAAGSLKRSLGYDQAEWDAFLKGVLDGEFNHFVEDAAEIPAPRGTTAVPA